MSKHKNYHILNLIGYGLSKFSDAFIQQFNTKTKHEFYNRCVQAGVADTVGVIKNRMDLFDPFFPDNGRKGWWQKGNAYIHRKYLIDNLFGDMIVSEFADVIKLYFKETLHLSNFNVRVEPIVKSRFKKMQETGLEAELYFMHNYSSIENYKYGIIKDARLYGDGYDFQISTGENSFLVEVKGIRGVRGRFRLTENEYIKAQEYKSDYVVVVVLNLDETPRFMPIDNPIQNLKFEERVIHARKTREYHLMVDIS